MEHDERFRWLMITTEDGETHQFRLNDFDADVEVGHVEVGGGPVRTVRKLKTIKFSGDIEYGGTVELP